MTEFVPNILNTKLDIPPAVSSVEATFDNTLATICKVEICRALINDDVMMHDYMFNR